MFYAFQEFIPVVHPTAYVHPQACVSGNVVIGPQVFIGAGASLRGDWGGIEIQAGCNVQENCIVHMFPGITVVLEEGAHIGHGAIIHGARVGHNSLIGMNAVLMDEVEVGPECIVGALSFIKAGEKIPTRSLVAGNPARIIREVSDEMLSWKTQGTKLYQQLPAEMYATYRQVEPLREMPANRPVQQKEYQIWKNVQ